MAEKALLEPEACRDQKVSIMIYQEAKRISRVLIELKNSSGRLGEREMLHGLYGIPHKLSRVFLSYHINISGELDVFHFFKKTSKKNRTKKLLVYFRTLSSKMIQIYIMIVVLLVNWNATNVEKIKRIRDKSISV